MTPPPPRVYVCVLAYLKGEQPWAATPSLSPAPAKQASPNAKAPAWPPTMVFTETARTPPPPSRAVGSAYSRSPVFFFAQSPISIFFR